jgi:capsular polysaccharide biosynthesis protein
MRTVPSGVAPCTRDVVSAEQYAEVDPAHTIVREMPRTIDAAVDPEFTNRRTFDSPATFVVTLPRGRVLHHAVLTRDGVLLADLSIEPNVVSANANEHSMLYRRSIPTITNVDGELVVLAAFGGADNYFHWMFDVLPRIETMTRAGHPITERTRVLIDGTRHPFQRETLAQLGIETLVDASAHPFVRADMLVVPSLPGIMGDVTAASCEFLRRSFLRGETATPKRIYVSRDGAANRRLLNEADVIARLAPLGFDVVRAETLSFHEQVALFSSAEVVIAPHGAGLTNIVFCGAGARVVELFSPSYVNGCYWGVAHQMNLDYWYLLGDGMRPEYDETHRGGADDFRVDLAKLDKLLERAGIS